MFIPNSQNILHKVWLYRLLVAIADDMDLTRHLCFKGGTCAAMLGYINRFSADLDFDFIGNKKDISSIRKRIEIHARELDLKIEDYSKTDIQYFLRYDAPKEKRNTIKLDVSFPIPKQNTYMSAYFADIDRTIRCQTIETMFANKLVSIIDRYEKYKSVAGRDLYDIHQFFLQNLPYRSEIIEERRGVSARTFIKQLINFVLKHFTETIITQDLNMLLPQHEFRKIRKILINETVNLLKNQL
ncbi:nucleotidyl transferase AbiEii/AbiGii toxin family protein [Candidatus Peregrinibacteria bacterium]|nr:nucleotidyl transferase AbiEii/AbiGii toxin family protein [Candidatus Peregrinibacteria bacterium]